MPLRAKIPKVDRLLATPEFALMERVYSGAHVLKVLRRVLEDIRSELASGLNDAAVLEAVEIAARVSAELERGCVPSLRRVVNATGTVMHTNLGRSPLPARLSSQLTETALHYTNLEYNLESGERGDRYSHVEPLICELTGAEAALVVNNNAAALLLALSCLAQWREVIVSRGELVEIGGSFRIPEIMTQSGAVLHEVGTTNRTHLKDYKKAINQNTALLLKVSCSNFAMVGFTAEADYRQLAHLGKEAGLPLVVDAGSGLFINLAPICGCRETTVGEYIRSGVDLVVCSGDKLLGGPQAGIIAGKRELVERMKSHPLLRALRLDKMTLCTLEGVLRLHRDEQTALREIPVLRMLTIPVSELKRWAVRILRRVRKRLPETVSAELVGGFGMAGGGTLPTLQLPTWLIALHSSTITPEQIEKALRTSKHPVIGRIFHDTFHLDTRTILDSDLLMLEKSLEALSVFARK